MKEEKTEEPEDDSYVPNGYITIGFLLYLVLKSLKLFDVSINSTLQWVWLGVAFVLIIIGTIKSFIDKMKE